MIFTYLPANYIPKLHLLGTYNFDFKSCQLRMAEFIFNLMHSDSVNQLTKIDNAFGVVLRKKRLGKKMTQEVLSNESALSRAYISELEMGHKDPSLYTIFRLSSALKIKPSTMIDEVERQI